MIVSEVYRYHAYTRPPIEGCIPAGYIEKRVLMSPLLRNKKEWYGYVDYHWKLPPSTVWRYELFPDDKVEAAIYTFYLEADRDSVEMNAMIDEYTSRPIEELQREAGKDVLAAAAVIIMKSRNETPNPTPTPILASTGLSRF